MTRRPRANRQRPTAASGPSRGTARRHERYSDFHSAASAFTALVENATRLDKAKVVDRLEAALVGLDYAYRALPKAPATSRQDQARWTIHYLTQEIECSLRKLRRAGDLDRKALEHFRRPSGVTPHVVDRLADPEVGHALWARHEESLRIALGDADRFWYVHDPTDPSDAKPVGASLADHIADVYVDLRRILAAFATNADPCSALTLTHVSFRMNWGKRIAEILYVLRNLAANADESIGQTRGAAGDRVRRGARPARPERRARKPGQSAKRTRASKITVRPGRS